MTVTSALLIAIKRNKRSVLLFLLSSTLLLFWISILIYISKKGGIGKDMAFLLYGTKKLRVKMQYMKLTLQQLGYIMAIGRYLFPPLLLMCAFNFSYFPLAEKIKKHIWILFVIPLCALVLYFPPIFKKIVGTSELMLRVVVNVSLYWILLYLVLTVVVMIYEYFSITSIFFRRRFLYKCMLLFSMTLLFAIYLPQDPAQVYMFYNSDYMWMLGLWYLSKAISTPVYLIIGIIAIASGSLGFFSFLRFAQIQWDEEREEATLKKRGALAKKGAGMFVHGIKNELIATDYLISDMEESLDDRERTEEYLRQLKALNKKLQERMQSLYSAFRSEDVHLQLTAVRDVIDLSLSKFDIKYPNVAVSLQIESDTIQVLADKEKLSEAIYNIVTNAYEATRSAKRSSPVLIEVHNERLWTSISITDFGMGIPKEVEKNIWEPFYSTKNSSTSWGMGMYYTRSIIKSHMGSVRFESKVGEGTTFIVLLPRQDIKTRGARWEI